MADLSTLIARRDALAESLASGVMSISVDGQSTSLASMGERQKMLQQYEDEIARCTGQPTRRPTASQVYLGGFQ